MAVSFVAKSEAGVTSGNAFFTIAKPTGTASGDRMFAVISSQPITITPPTGWTLVNRIAPEGSGLNLSVYTKLAGSSEPSSYVFTVDQQCSAALLTYRDCGFDVTGDPTSSGFSSTTVECPSVTAARDGAVVAFYAVAGSTAWTPPTGMTERVDYAASALTPSTVGVADNLSISAGATGTKTATSDAGGNNAGMLVALGAVLQHNLAASLSAAVTGSASLRKQVALGAALTPAVTAAPVLAVTKTLAGSFSASAVCSGSLLKEALLSAGMTATASAVLDVPATPLGAELSVEVTATPTLSVTKTLAASLGASVSTDMYLDAGLELRANLPAAAVMTPTLSLNVPLASSLTVSAGQAAQVLLQVRAAASLAGSVVMAPTLSLDVGLAASFSASAGVTADVRQEAPLVTALTASAAMAAGLTVVDAASFTTTERTVFYPIDERDVEYPDEDRTVYI